MSTGFHTKGVGNWDASITRFVDAQIVVHPSICPPTPKPDILYETLVSIKFIPEEGNEMYPYRYQGFIQDFRLGGGNYLCISEAWHLGNSSPEFFFIGDLASLFRNSFGANWRGGGGGGGEYPSFHPPTYETLHIMNYIHGIRPGGVVSGCDIMCTCIVYMYMYTYVHVSYLYSFNMSIHMHMPIHDHDHMN